MIYDDMFLVTAIALKACDMIVVVYHRISL